MAIQNACVMVVCVWALTPPLAYSGVARLASLSAVGGWLLIEAYRPRGIVRAPTLPVFLVFVYLVYTILLEVLTRGVSGIISSSQLYIMLFFLLAQQARRNEMASLYTVFWLVICLNVIWMSSTLAYLSMVDARAMRVLVRSGAEAEALSALGVGGYAMAYGAVLLLPALTILSLRPRLIDRLQPPRFMKTIPLLPRLTIWYLTAVSITLIVRSQFSTAVLVLAVVLSLTLILWRLSNLRLLAAVFAIFFLVLFGEALIIEVLLVLRNYAEETNYTLKINDMLAALQTDDVSGTAQDRIERYVRSAKLFLASPLWGVLDYTDVGKHSTILDAFARWGVVIGAILVYLVSFVQIRALRSLHAVSGGAGVALGTLAAVLLVFGLNKHFMAAGITIFIIYPLVYSAMNSRPSPKVQIRSEAAHA
ncbi:hypothetical protein FAP39_14260 [Shimia litoralis]|uniref:O-antigen ligase family protein n=1 Tax=Shimia litoralis TaxID=420403 RepID=A0A4U7MX13_9RHOB|nr:hypothetical protein [Shimia litoralis]TKZ17447.1 hypothetical protein FAP39_14260 [Shimia litoralis]